VRVQYVLDLGRGDVLTSTDDRVVGTAVDVEVVLGVHPAIVAGIEPPLGIQAGALPDVLAGDLRTAHPEPPDLTGR
jgi:hypothetical protein